MIEANAIRNLSALDVQAITPTALALRYVAQKLNSANRGCVRHDGLPYLFGRIATEPRHEFFQCV